AGWVLSESPSRQYAIGPSPRTTSWYGVGPGHGPGPGPPSGGGPFPSGGGPFPPGGPSRPVGLVGSSQPRKPSSTTMTNATTGATGRKTLIPVSPCPQSDREDTGRKHHEARGTRLGNRQRPQLPRLLAAELQEEPNESVRGQEEEEERAREGHP